MAHKAQIECHLRGLAIARLPLTLSPKRVKRRRHSPVANVGEAGDAKVQRVRRNEVLGRIGSGPTLVSADDERHGSAQPRTRWFLRSTPHRGRSDRAPPRRKISAALDPIFWGLGEAVASVSE